ncbi:hypothetical protein HK101_008118 [Irineochytrium annulatum]|nr:hypothetical protein HK101_008118 [Irineochytrium annulatum]
MKLLQANIERIKDDLKLDPSLPAPLYYSTRSAKRMKNNRALIIAAGFATVDDFAKAHGLDFNYAQLIFNDLFTSEAMADEYDIFVKNWT